MTTAIRTWADSDFYLSSAGTANAREQILKLQSIGKLVRALSDASTVDTNGDKLQDRLLGLSLGDLTQRHKYRVLYDNLNDRFLVQRNSGTDASKVWVELLRLDASGNLTPAGTLSADSLTTTLSGITLGGNLDLNDFYLRNVDKNVGQFRTDSLLVHGGSTLTGAITAAGAVTLQSTLSVAGATTLTGATTVQGAEVFDYTYSATAASQLISAGVNTDLTFLTAITLPNTSATLTDRKFLLEFVVSFQETSGASNLAEVRAYNGANGTKADTVLGVWGTVTGANSVLDQVVGRIQFNPVGASATKVGLAITCVGTVSIAGLLGAHSSIKVSEVTT